MRHCVAVAMNNVCCLAAGLAVAAILLTGPAIALDPDRSILQYKHTRWGPSEGAPSGVNAIAQTPDGFLWLASNDGLYRFDGINFERIDRQVDVGSDGPPFRLLATRNGDLWVYYPSIKRFAVYRDGRLRTVRAPKPEGTVIELAETPDGDVWVAGGLIGQPMLRFHKGRWSKVQPSGSHGRDTNMGMVVTQDGALWVAYANNVFRRSLGGSRFEHMFTEPGARMNLSLDPAGRVWTTGIGGSRAVTAPGGRWTGLPTSIRYPGDDFRRRGLPMFDRDGNLWIARRKDGLERLRLPSAIGPIGPAPPPAQFRVAEGLTSDAITAIHEDREGTIWVGTSLGLDRFRNADIAFEPRLNETAAFGDILFANSAGDVFIGQRSTIYRVRPRENPEPVLTGVTEPEAICEGPDKSIWIVLADHVALLQGERHARFPKPAGLETTVKGCGADRWGRLWLSAEGNGLYLRTASGWNTFPNALFERFQPAQMVTDRSGDLWVNGGPGKLARIDRQGPTVVNYTPDDNLSEVRTMAAAGAGLLLASSHAIGFWERGRLSIAYDHQVGRLFAVNGAVSTPAGETWIFARNGITRTRTTDLERAFRDRRFRLPVRTFDFLDGLIDSNAVRTSPTLVRGGDGRLWATTATGTVWIDPAKLTFNPLPPKIAISSIEFGDRRLLDPRSLDLPAGSSNVAIGFAALSLRIPERVQVRYRLEGQDRAWLDPGTRRKAFYTNLGPGTYRFRVVAANENGVWNDKGATLEFAIAPTFLQSIWFKLLLAIALIALLAAAYVLRLRQVTSRLQSDFDVRTTERERIARELHDTLLQGFQGLLLQFKAVANSLPDGKEPRRNLDRSLERAQQVLIDGRDRVKELRVQNDAADLAETLLNRASAEVSGRGPRVHLTQEGTARTLHPLVHEELLRIVEEAVRNAALHAQASSIEILILWSWRALRLAVRDDGVGMPVAVLMNGKRAGHFGLVGMRERAERIGGSFAVNSRLGAGTEVALEVPAHAAYRERPFRLFDRASLWLARKWR